MFDNLSDKLDGVFRKLKGHGKLSEKNISDGLREVRLALLEADVNYKVVKKFIADIKARAVGQEVQEQVGQDPSGSSADEFRFTGPVGNRHHGDDEIVRPGTVRLAARILLVDVGQQTGEPADDAAGSARL